MEKDPVKKHIMRSSYINEDLPRYLAFAEKLLADNGTEYFSGDNLALSDLSWYVFLKWHMSGVIDGCNVGFIHNFPKLRNLYYNVHFNPKVREWNDSHSKIKLTYFDIPGLAGASRMAFHIGGIPF